MSWPHDGHVMVFLISSVLGGSRTFVFSLEVAVIIWRALSSSESLHHVISLFLLSCPSQNSIFPLVSSISSENRDHSSYQHTDIEKLKKIEKNKRKKISSSKTRLSLFKTRFPWPPSWYQERNLVLLRTFFVFLLLSSWADSNTAWERETKRREREKTERTKAIKEGKESEF